MEEKVKRLETEVSSILLRLREGDKEFNKLKDAIYTIHDKLNTGLNPLIKWKNGVEETILLTEAMERTLAKLSAINERTEILDDMLKFKKALRDIRKTLLKYIRPILSFLWKIGFIIFLILLIASFMKGEITILDLIKKFF